MKKRSRTTPSAPSETQPNLTSLAIHINTATTNPTNLLSQFTWISSTTVAALLLVEHGRKLRRSMDTMEKTKNQDFLSAASTLLSQRTHDSSLPDIGPMLATRFLRLHSANQFQRASRILTACLECAIKSESKVTTSVTSSQALQSIESVPSFVSTVARCLCNFGLSRPAAKLIEYALVHYLNSGALESAFLWVRVLLRSLLTLVAASDTRQLDDLMTMLAQVLVRTLRGVTNSGTRLSFQQRFWSTTWKIMNESSPSTLSKTTLLSRTLSCLRLCSAVDAQLSLQSLLDSELNATRSIGSAVVQGLTGQETSHLARLQALELCCSWLSSQKKRTKKQQQDTHVAIASSAEVWLLTSTSALSDIFVNANDGNMPGNFIQRLRTTLSSLLSSCSTLRPLIANTMCTHLTKDISLKQGRLLLSLLCIPQHSRTTHWLLSLSTATLHTVKHRVLRVMQCHEWSEIRQLACTVLLSLGSYAQVLVEAAAAAAATVPTDTTMENMTEMDVATGHGSSNPASLLVALEYHARCGHGGKFRVEVHGTVSLLLMLQKGTGGIGTDVALVNLAGDAVSTALALPVASLVPLAPEFVAAACRLLVHLAPQLSNMQQVSLEEEREGEKVKEPDYADPAWITCRGCCLLMQRLIAVSPATPATSLVTYEYSDLVEWGRLLIDVVRETDHHGAMQRLSAVLQHIATALVMKDSESQQNGKNGKSETSDKSDKSEQSETGMQVVQGWMKELVERATSMHALARIRFSHDLPPCLMALMKGIIKAAEEKRKQKRKLVKKEQANSRSGTKNSSSSRRSNISNSSSKKRKHGLIDNSTTATTTTTTTNAMDTILSNASDCLYNGCVFPLLTLAANTSASIPSRIAAFHVLIRVFETHKLRCFVLKKYQMKDAVELAIGCCQASVPYALSSAAALFWSVVIDVMISAAAGNREQCTPVTLFLQYPSLVDVLNVHTQRLTLNVLQTNQSDAHISTGLSTPLVLLSLCSQLAPPVGDPLQLHRLLCGGLVTLCHALLSSPQMLFRLLAAKSLARMTHSEELNEVVEQALLQLASSKRGALLPMNTVHGLLLQLVHLKLMYGSESWVVLQERVANVMKQMIAADARVMRCGCTAEMITKLS